jgi:hypothetical protein
MGEQLKKTVAGEVLTEEDDGEGNLVAQLHEPALWAGSGCRRGTMTRHSFWPGRTAQCSSSATAGEEMAGAEQSSEEHSQTEGRGKAKWAAASSVTSGAVVRGGATHVGGNDQRPPALSSLRAVSVATENRGGVRDRETVLGGQTEMGR